MTRDHKYYEAQSALAAVGQLSDVELIDFERHASVCSSCREIAAEMATISRELFLMEARKATRVGTPAGMEQRFLERASNAGVPVRRSIPVLSDARTLRLAFVALLLLISVSLGWRLLSPGTIERDAVMETSASRDAEVSAANLSEHKILHMAASKTEVRRRLTLKHKNPARFRSSPEAGHTYFALYQPSLTGSASVRRGLNNLATDSIDQAKSYLTVGGHFPTHTSLSKAYIPDFRGVQERSSTDQRLFHYDVKLASLSLLDAPRSSASEPANTAFKFNTSVFHLDLSRAW
jgi:hypothetical protein